MLDSSPLLTIAIPTYNRAHYLEGLLAALLDRLKGEARVELLVSDNASTDQTSEVVSEYQRRGLAIHSICNAENLGADRNILQCYERASGKYVWVFSDDDLILPGTLDRVLNALTPGEFDVIYVTARPFETEGKAVRPFLGSPQSREFSKAEGFARSVHVFFTFISGVIVHKERVSSMPHRPFESLLSTNLVQLGPVFSALNHHRRSLLIREPLIAARSNSNVGYALYKVFGTNFASITREWLVEASVQQAIINGTIRRFLPFWIMKSREDKASSVPEDPHKILGVCYGSNMRYWIFNYPIYALPIPLARMWLLGVRIINKLEALIGEL